ncbi:LytTR family DNA-binding domain-containing protein [Oscillospiraceae bacterium MB08-C2-2]|nr:LytTR family DNA-binding domain-containing protein [Oscillospiraceae bacterium MB08-C2-2]
MFLCDDDSRVLERYKQQIVQISENNDVEVSISAFQSGESLLFHMSDYPDMADIIYLDIYMKDINGIDTAKQLREWGCNAYIIFLTVCSESVYDSFEVFPFYYLRKEYTPDVKFEHVFMLALRHVDNGEPEKIILKNGAERKVVPLNEISHFEIWQGVVTVCFGENETFRYWATLEDLEKLLSGKGFVRVHRSYMVNMQYITCVQRRSVLLKNGEDVPVGVTYGEKVKKALTEHISKQSK